MQTQYENPVQAIKSGSRSQVARWGLYSGLTVIAVIIMLHGFLLIFTKPTRSDAEAQATNHINQIISGEIDVEDDDVFQPSKSTLIDANPHSNPMRHNFTENFLYVLESDTVYGNRFVYITVRSDLIHIPGSPVTHTIYKSSSDLPKSYDSEVYDFLEAAGHDSDCGEGVFISSDPQQRALQEVDIETCKLLEQN